MPTLEPILIFLLGYVGIGLAFAVQFVMRLVQRLDDAAAGTSIGFRLLILPGAVVFWPLLAYRIAHAKDRR